MYIIQTNTSLDKNNHPVDFQSMMYKVYRQQTWSEFKNYIISNKPSISTTVIGTMLGANKPDNSKCIEVLINDDVHLEVIFQNNNNLKFSSKYVLVTDEQFQNLL